MKEPVESILRLKRNFPELSLEMFGAKGDGITDDTDAVQQCIDVSITLQWAIYDFTQKHLKEI